MIVLAENAYTKDELNAAEIEKRLKEIKEMQFESFSKEKFIIQIEENKLKARLKVALR